MPIIFTRRISVCLSICIRVRGRCHKCHVVRCIDACTLKYLHESGETFQREHTTGTGVQYCSTSVRIHSTLYSTSDECNSRRMQMKWCHIRLGIYPHVEGKSGERATCSTALARRNIATSQLRRSFNCFKSTRMPFFTHRAKRSLWYRLSIVLINTWVFTFTEDNAFASVFVVPKSQAIIVNCFN